MVLRWRALDADARQYHDIWQSHTAEATEAAAAGDDHRAARARRVARSAAESWELHIQPAHTLALLEDAERFPPTPVAAPLAPVIPLREADASPADDGDSQSAKLVKLALRSDLVLFHGSDGTAWAGVGAETWKLRGKGFKTWLQGEFWAAHAQPPTSQSLQDALGVLEARAVHEGERMEAHVRVAGYDGKIYIDLANEAREVVEVSGAGWRIVTDSPVRFWRPRGLSPLVRPAAGGSVAELRRFVNVSEASWPLVVTWLAAALRPEGPYPVLGILGEQGSAKTTTARLLRALVDPAAAGLRSEPRGGRDLMVAAANGWVLGFDNVSRIEPWLSDALCRLSTGGGWGTRELYANDEEFILEATRPVLLTGIEDFVTRGDLLDRSLLVRLHPITATERRTEADLWAAFDEAAPRIMGGLFDAIAVGLGRLPHVRLAEHPRMADFAEWAVAVEPGLGLAEGEFLSAYADNTSRAAAVALESTLVGPVLVAFMATRTSWTGTAGDLLNELGRVDFAASGASGWPKTPKGLTDALRRIAPALREAEGITISREARSKTARLLTVTREG